MRICWVSIVYILHWCYLQIPPLLQGSRFLHNNVSSRFRTAIFAGPLARHTALIMGCQESECSCKDEAYIKLFFFFRNNRKIAIPQEGGDAKLLCQGQTSRARLCSCEPSLWIDWNLQPPFPACTSCVPLFSVREHFGCNSRNTLCVQLFIAFCWCTWWCQVPVCIFVSLGEVRHTQLSKYHVLVGREEKATFSLGFV